MVEGSQVEWDGTAQQEHPALAGSAGMGISCPQCDHREWWHPPAHPCGIQELFLCVHAAPEPPLPLTGMCWRLLNYSNFQIAVLGLTSLERVKMFSLIEHLLPLILSLFKGSLGCCGWDVPGFCYLRVLTVLGTAQPCSLHPKKPAGCGVPLSLMSLGWHCPHCSGTGASWLLFFPPGLVSQPSGIPTGIPIPTPSPASCLRGEGDPEGTIPSVPAQFCLDALQNRSPNSFQRMCRVISQWVNCQVN